MKRNLNNIYSNSLELCNIYTLYMLTISYHNVVFYQCPAIEDCRLLVKRNYGHMRGEP